MSETDCGGCRDMGSHRRHCPRHPDYHPFIVLADRAESIGDWALAGAIREAVPDHPYRNLNAVRPTEDRADERGL